MFHTALAFLGIFFIVIGAIKAIWAIILYLKQRKDLKLCSCCVKFLRHRTNLLPPSFVKAVCPAALLKIFSSAVTAAFQLPVSSPTHYAVRSTNSIQVIGKLGNNPRLSFLYDKTRSGCRGLSAAHIPTQLLPSGMFVRYTSFAGSNMIINDNIITLSLQTFYRHLSAASEIAGCTFAVRWDLHTPQSKYRYTA